MNSQDEKPQFTIQTSLLWITAVAVLLVLGKPWLSRLTFRRQLLFLGLVGFQLSFYFLFRFARLRYSQILLRRAKQKAGSVHMRLRNDSVLRSKKWQIWTPRVSAVSFCVYVIFMMYLVVSTPGPLMYPMAVPFVAAPLLLACSWQPLPSEILHPTTLLCENGAIVANLFVPWSEVKRAERNSINENEFLVYQAYQQHVLHVPAGQMETVQALVSKKLERQPNASQP